MSKKDQEKIKNITIVATAMIVPGGLVALGLWKAMELLNKKKKEKKK